MLRANVWNSNLTLLTDHHTLQFANREMNITEAAIFEAKALIREGGKINHPVWGSKDITDSLAILNYDLMNLEVSEVAEDFNVMSDAKIALYIERYFKERPKAIASGIAVGNEKEINEFARRNLGLSEYNFKILHNLLMRR